MCSCDRPNGQFCPVHLAQLREFVQASEDMASSDPMMPSHDETVKRFDSLLESAKSLLGVS